MSKAMKKPIEQCYELMGYQFQLMQAIIKRIWHRDADGYFCNKVDGQLTNPWGSFDTKLVDFDHAVRTSICHSIKLVSVSREGYSEWPILISTPNTPDTVLEVQIHIAVANSMWRICVTHGCPYHIDLICIVAAAIRRLCDEEYSTRQPLTHRASSL